MEDVARLAVVEYTISDVNNFNKLLHELLQQIYDILDDPHDLDVRTLKSDYIKEAMKHGVFCEYLKYIGFQPVNGEYVFPKEETLSKLRFAQASIQRKLSICYGSKDPTKKKQTKGLVKINKPQLKPVYVESDNPLFNRIQMLFNNVLFYENDDTQAKVRKLIPLIPLQQKAVERVREHQRKLKVGEVKGNDLSFETALLLELMGWFKNEFFTWIDKPACEHCGGTTYVLKVVQRKMETETCTVEVFKCSRCKRDTLFPRYNDVRSLLRTRRGRCGEWANCFALFCRTLGYDTRHVFDTNDHVWCEVFDYESDSWLHVDPCECLVDAPLVYCCGWGTQLAYVIAISRDDLQDVTWRYTTDHKQVMKRRLLCEESELVWYIMEIRRLRQAQVSEARRRYLAKRTVKELVQLMVEKKPADYEKRSRVSGSLNWRELRGEVNTSYTFQFKRPGSYSVEYCTVVDAYLISYEGRSFDLIETFDDGTYKCENMFRKEEKDWKKVYLARHEGAEKGLISWKIEVDNEKFVMENLHVELCATTFENGRVRCTVQFDDDKPLDITLEAPSHLKRKFKQAVITCYLSGGVGDRAWQHAQLMRQSLDARDPSMTLTTNVIKTSNT